MILAGFSPVPGPGILFSRDLGVPRPVQEFAWRVVETRCSFQSYERERRSFWAYDARASRVDGGVAYAIDVLSEIPWKKTQPPALIQMTIVDDDGSLRLTALRSAFAVCRNQPA